MYKEINKCRISGSTDLVPILDLGEQFLTGVFPSSPHTPLTRGPVNLIWCPDSNLVQLKQSYDLDEMYGDNYGYRSGLNQSMVNHLELKAKYLTHLGSLQSGNIILDIGSNDATSLKSYASNFRKIGIDPTGLKFKNYYPDEIQLIPDFFSAKNFKSVFKDEKASLITSIAMFYDLEDPVQFAREIAEILSPNGLWHFEQSYLPSMLRTHSYDTVCQEHIEYYSLLSIQHILQKADLFIVDVALNDINGGSFAVTAAHKSSNRKPNTPIIEWLIEEEFKMGLNTIKPYNDFARSVEAHKKSLISLLDQLKNDGKRIMGYGASTKGNVLLQYCGISTQYLDAIAEVNEQKFGCYTPGTSIPIISQVEALQKKPDYFLVLPWHFRHSILNKSSEFRLSGGKFIFPLPYIEVV
jgi:hypothetical protein